MSNSQAFQVATVVGARPQFVKAATVSRALRSEGLREILIHTGQHYDEKMSDIFFSEMEIPRPDYFLGISGMSHGAMTGEMLKKIEEVLLKTKPDVVLVYGDTNSTLAGALAAAKLNIPVAHVEAGLRSFNMKMPEEINRTLTDRISRWLYCPTTTAVKNLESEGYRAPNFEVVRTGDVMYDAALFYVKKARWPTSLESDLQTKSFALCTLHRQENTDDPETLRSLIDSLRETARRLPVVWPVHPRTRKALTQNGMSTEGLTLLEPVSYFEMLALLKACRFVMTDSGGLQKEAYFFERPCLTLRPQTEWKELVNAGVNFLCGADDKLVMAAIDRVLSMQSVWPKALYGDGHSAEAIVSHLKSVLLELKG